MNISFSFEKDTNNLDVQNNNNNDMEINRKEKLLKEQKELVSRKFTINNEIERKMKLFEELTIKNQELKQMNSDLTDNLDKVNKHFRDKKQENTIISSKKINEIKRLYTVDIPSVDNDEETIKLKEEYDFLEINLKAKTKYEGDLKRKIKDNRILLKNIESKLKLETENLVRAKV
jgi:hypothetical protein